MLIMLEIGYSAGLRLVDVDKLVGQELELINVHKDTWRIQHFGWVEYNVVDPYNKA